jgi:hypothetical protein
MTAANFKTCETCVSAGYFKISENAWDNPMKLAVCNCASSDHFRHILSADHPACLQYKEDKYLEEKTNE